MSNDLHRILSDVADQAAAASPALPVEAIIFQRRRRRAVTRTVGAGGIAAGLTAVAVVAGVLNGPDDTPVPPAVPTPSVSPSPAPTIPPVAPPVCGGGTEGIPVELTLTAEPEQTLGAATTGTVEAAAGVLTGRSVSLALLADGVVIAQTEGSEAADPASTVEGAAGADPAAISGVLEACGGALAAGEYQLVAVADGAAGAVVSAPMDVTLREVEQEVVVDPSAGWEPLPEANGFNLGEEPFTSDDPGATQPLPDGRYWAAVENIDPTTRSFDATIEIMRLGDDAIEWAKVNEPYSVDEDGDMTPAVNYSPTAFGTQRMTVPVDARIYSWCQASPEGYMRESPIEYLVSPTPGCDYSTGSGEDFDGGYWLDVRGGEIRQMVSIFAS
ncbi:hypothetical protein [Cellulomonas taurus]|uniref:hypothetical protein n=1 Tax=Cellulomonas taurus TaxID=2729175 RepID=UPI00145F5823|nr:hypothetical protein [Cellulomonas taurus]